MRFLLTSGKSGALKPAYLKNIGEVLSEHVPEEGQFEAFIACAGATKMRLLNRSWRGKDKATNVLSYPQLEPKEVAPALKKLSPGSKLYLGDVIVCLPVIEREARQLKKPVNHHLTHLIVHGVLHLLGYDHATPRKAHTMEKLEKAILADLDLPDPYILNEPLPRIVKRLVKRMGKRS